MTPHLPAFLRKTAHAWLRCVAMPFVARRCVAKPYGPCVRALSDLLGTLGSGGCGCGSCIRGDGGRGTCARGDGGCGCGIGGSGRGCSALSWTRFLVGGASSRLSGS